MDRNQIIGFSLLAVLLIGYIAYNNHSAKQFREQQRADSIANAQAHPKPLVDSSKNLTLPSADAAMNDSLRNLLPPAFRGTAETVILENSKLELKFSTKGAHPVSARIKSYKTYDNDSLIFFNGADNQLSFTLPNGKDATGDLYYVPAFTEGVNGSKILSFTADLGNGQSAVITYTLPADDYMLQYKLQLNGMNAKELPLTWKTTSLHTERDITNERTNSQLYYKFKDGDQDYFTIRGDKKESLNQPVLWLGFRMHFFSTALISTEGFHRVDIDATTNLPEKNLVAKNKAVFAVPVAADNSISLKWYIGPNHYQTLRAYKLDLDDMVPLGFGLMSFVKYINKWLIIPIFNVLSSFIGNFGIIIMLMTIIIRLLLSFFTYKSYLSTAKMRVLKPEIDELRAKYKDDQQKFGMEQMKLFRSAGVNPLGGCLPTLFQLPILFAMYYFFPSSIELRQESFLWANDLSTYDSIASWSANIPVLSSVYGNHISLFTLLMTASSLFLALYNRNMMGQDQSNPVLKYMPYVFPFLLIGIFNKMAAALTFYYFFSNMISITQQFIIQKYIIDEKKIHAQIQEKRNAPATPSKWQAKMEEIQKAQLEKAKQRTKK